VSTKLHPREPPRVNPSLTHKKTKEHTGYAGGSHPPTICIYAITRKSGVSLLTIGGQGNILVNILGNTLGG